MSRALAGVVLGAYGAVAFVACTGEDPALSANEDATAPVVADAAVTDGPGSETGLSDAGRFCQRATDAKACLDFDDGVLTPNPWRMSVGDAGERLALVASDASSPYAAGLEVPFVDAGARVASFAINLPRDLDDGVDIETVLSLDAVPASGTIGLLRVSAMGGVREVSLLVGGATMTLDVDDPTVDGGNARITFTRPAGTMRVRLRTSFRNAKRTTLWLNDVEVASVPAGLTNIVDGYEVHLQAYAMYTTGVTRVRFDDVVVRSVRQ